MRGAEVANSRNAIGKHLKELFDHLNVLCISLDAMFLENNERHIGRRRTAVPHTLASACRAGRFKARTSLELKSVMSGCGGKG